MQEINQAFILVLSLEVFSQLLVISKAVADQTEGFSIVIKGVNQHFKAIFGVEVEQEIVSATLNDLRKLFDFLGLDFTLAELGHSWLLHDLILMSLSLQIFEKEINVFFAGE